jgi:VWFA-related protein
MPALQRVALAGGSRLRRVFAIVALTALAAAGHSAGQQAPPAPQAQQPPPPSQEKPAPERAFPPVVESVDVSITSVEVVVTDSKGNRVPGLKASDFEVKQDGITQPITNFYAVAGGKLLLEDGSSIDLGSREQEAEVPNDVKAKYIFYVDNLNIQPLNRNRMFRRLKEFVPTVIGPNSEGMVVTFNRSLKVIRPFTSDVNDILGAIESIETDTGGGTNTISEWKDTLARIADARTSDAAISATRSYAQAVRNDMEFTIDAIKQTLDSMAGLQGRKSLLYMSEGLPQSIGLELFEVISTKFQDTSAMMQQFDFDISTKYLKIIQAANASGVTIYTLDASGLTTADVTSADTKTNKDVHVSEFTARQNMQGPIRMMAEETGGTSAINTNDWKTSLDGIAADFSNYYSLGFRSARGAADRPHAIEVVVKNKALRVRSRRSYVEKSIETRTAEAVVASLTYPRTDNPLQANLSVGEPKPHDRENFALPVRISLPISRLGLVPAGDLYEGQFLIYFVVRDASGNQSDLQIQRQEIKIPSKDFATAQRKDYYYDATLLVVPGGQKLAIGVRDSVSNLTSFLQKNVFVSVLPKESKPEAGKPGS